jgi:hypothetical protein
MRAPRASAERSSRRHPAPKVTGTRHPGRAAEPPPVSARYWQIQGGNELPQWLLTNLSPLPVPSKKTSNGAFQVAWLFFRRRAPYHHRPGRRQLGRGRTGERSRDGRQRGRLAGNSGRAGIHVHERVEPVPLHSDSGRRLLTTRTRSPSTSVDLPCPFSASRHKLFSASRNSTSTGAPRKPSKTTRFSFTAASSGVACSDPLRAARAPPHSSRQPHRVPAAEPRGPWRVRPRSRL